VRAAREAPTALKDAYRYRLVGSDDNPIAINIISHIPSLLNS
jgi:hypothetical protein